ncbi:MAG: hypothetical protein ACKO0Z_13750 [Betaproteobacteria bacterium]
MKHLLIILFIALTAYFAWHYTPQRPKFFIKEFLGKHFLIVAVIVVGTIAGLFAQTVFHSTQII